MKTILALVACLGLVGCTEEAYVVPPNVGADHVSVGVVNVCDDTNTCTDINSQYYYDAAGDLYYYNNGYWIGSGGYWYGRNYYHGFYPGYRGVYNRGYYGGRVGAYGEGVHSNFHASVRGGQPIHGGGNFHGGSHGGHR